MKKKTEIYRITFFEQEVAADTQKLILLHSIEQLPSKILFVQQSYKLENNLWI